MSTKLVMTKMDYAIINEYHTNGGNKVEAFEKHCRKTGNPNRQTLNNRAHQFFRRADVKAELIRIEQKAFEGACITKQYVLETTKEAIERCMQHTEVLKKNGEPAMVQTENGMMAPQFKFDAAGALKGCDMLMKHKGLYEADNSQKSVTSNAIKDMSPKLKQELIAKLRKLSDEEDGIPGSGVGGGSDAGSESGTTH